MRKTSFFVALAIAVFAHAASAACRVQTAAVVTPVVSTPVVATNVVAVPLAVTVGVPVAQVTPYYYSYQAAASALNPTEPSDAALDMLATRIATKLRAAPSPTAPIDAAAIPHATEPTQSAERPAASVKSSAHAALVSQKCGACHSGANPKGNLSLDDLNRLDCPTRLKAVRAVLTEKMPKGGPRLTPTEAGQILEELTQTGDE